MSTISALQSFVVHLLLLLSMVGGSVRSVTGKQNRGKRWSTAYQGWTELEERRNTTIDNMVARALRPTSPGWTPSQWIYQSWRQKGKRRSSSSNHASSSCHFPVIFQCTESSNIPVLSQVAPYCDIMNCVTGALRRRKGWKWTWLFIKTPEGSLKPQFWAYEVFSWWNVSLYGTFVRACLAPTHRSHTTRSTMSRIIHTIMAPTEEREEIKIL